MKTLQHLNNSWMKVVAVFFSLIVISSFSATASEYDKWGVHNPDDKNVINHTPMSNIYKFLNDPKSKKGKVAYYRSQGKALEYVTNYRKYLEKIPVSILNKNEQLAFWLNLHNVAVIEMFSNKLKLTKKVKRSRGTPGNPGKEWAKKRVTVESIPLSLEEIEQNILIAHWKEPLIIYGLIYGTKGSPAVGIEGFQGNTVHNQLTNIAKKFISNKRNVNASNDRVILSSLYIWNKDTLFAGDDAVLIAHLQQYADSNTLPKLKKVIKVSDTHKYKWTTNAEAKPRRSSIGSSGSGSYGGGS